MSTSHFTSSQQLFTCTSVTCMKRLVGMPMYDKKGMSLNQLEWGKNHLREWHDDNSWGEAIDASHLRPLYKRTRVWADLFINCDSFTHSAWWRCYSFPPSRDQKQMNYHADIAVSKKANLLQHADAKHSLSNTAREQSLKQYESKLMLFSICRSRNHMQSTLSLRNSMDAQQKQPTNSPDCSPNWMDFKRRRLSISHTE